MTGTELVLSTDLLAKAIDVAKLGTPHACVAATAKRADVGSELDALAELDRLGLVSRPGTLSADFVAVLAMLTKPQAECSAWIAGPEPGRDTAVLAASIGRDAVLARRTGDQVSLRPGNPLTLIEDVVRELPYHPNGMGHSITVRQADFTAAPARRHPAQAAADHRPPESGVAADVVALRRLIGQPRRSSAQLYVARRKRSGRRVRAERPLTVLDTAGCGRWCTYLDLRGRRGEPWIVAAPAYQHWLIGRLTELAAALAPQRGITGAC